LSYKFQRLRERIRSAIRSGELAGKLPGERALARRFHVNAKTLSKALNDLAAEGLLERSVGRGTYVAGQMPEELRNNRWLIVADGPADANPLIAELLKLNGESRIITQEEALRPSVVAQCSLVVNCSANSSADLYRQLALRGIPVIETDHLPQHHSTHAALLDRHLAAFNLGRDLLLAGHSRLAALDMQGSTAVLNGLSQAARRYGNGIVETLTPEQLGEALEDNTTAFICDGNDLAGQILCMLDTWGIRPGGRSSISLCAIGMMTQEICCSGYYIDPARQASAVAEVARSIQAHRNSILWLSGTYLDRGTMATRLERMPGRVSSEMQAMVV